MPEEHAEMKRLLEETLTIAKENNVMLKKLRRDSMIGMVMRVLWFALIIGLPFAVYFYILEPYLAVFGTSVDQLKTGLSEVPGFKGFTILFGQP